MYSINQLSVLIMDNTELIISDLFYNMKLNLSSKKCKCLGNLNSKNPLILVELSLLADGNSVLRA